MLAFIHQLPDWPKFRWRDESLAGPLAATVRHQGHLLGRMESLGFKLREEATLRTLTEEVVKTSEIEGEHLNEGLVRSSLARRLGMEQAAFGATIDCNIEGIVEVILDATRCYDKPVTDERLFGWHAALFPDRTERDATDRRRAMAQGRHRGGVGAGRQATHPFRGAPAERVPREMKAFLAWFNDRGTDIDLVLKAGISRTFGSSPSIPSRTATDASGARSPT